MPSQRPDISRLSVALALGLVVLGATAGRWYSAAHLFHPDFASAGRISGDEMVYIWLGDRLWREGAYSTAGIEQSLLLDERNALPEYLRAPLFKHPPLFPGLVGLSRLAGGTFESAFWPSLTMGAVGLLAVFWLAVQAGLSRRAGLLVTALLAVSPVHWIASSRIWLDATLTTFVTLAVAAQVRGGKSPAWYLPMGVFWGLAALTKYTAIAGWVGAAIAGAFSPPGRARRLYRAGHALGLSVVLPWFLIRFMVEGWDVVAFWQSDIQDWRAVARLLVWAIPIALVTLLLARFRKRVRVWPVRLQPSPAHLVLGATATMALLVSAGLVGGMSGIPWTGWGDNELRAYPITFYVTYPLRFEPIVLLGLVALAGLSGRARDLLAIKASWLGLFSFVTLWGNYQSRYGLPLMPLQHVMAVALLAESIRSEEGGTRSVMIVLSCLWLVGSIVRSLWLLDSIAIPNDFFYF